MNNDLKIGKLQFYWRMRKSMNDKPNIVPNFVDFSFSFDSKYQLIKQKKNELTLEYLNKVYKENYNVGYLQEGHALADLYGDDFLNFITKSIENHQINVEKIAEIGAGGCYLLNQLKNKGFKVQAIDPSPVSIDAGKRLEIRIIDDFYPSKKLDSKFDLIYHYDVLEHIEEPVTFINHIYDDLTEGGIMVVAVPDCSEYIQYGDISMILHEHINYFDQESFKNVINSSKLNLLEIKKSKYGKVLYCIAKKEREVDIKNIIHDDKKFIKFKTQTLKLKNKILKHIMLNYDGGKKIGFYIPLRALPYISLLEDIDRSLFRFFDDNPALRNNLFDGFDIPIENVDTLNSEHLDTLYILSEAFGDKLKAKVLGLNDKINVLTLDDFI